MKTNLAWVLSLLSAVVVGCASPEEEPLSAADDEVVSAPAATGEGELDGKLVTFVEAAADALVRTKSGGKVISSSAVVDLSSGTSTCTETKKNAQALNIRFSNNKGDIEPGDVFEVGDQARRVSAQYFLTDKSCEMATAKISAESGHLKVTKATAQRIVGEYELSFGEHGTLKGTFDAPTCLKSFPMPPVCAE